MTCIDELESAIAVQDTEEHGGVAADLGMFAQEAIDVIEDQHRIRAGGHAGKRPLKHRREQRRAESFPGNIGDEKGGAVVTHGKHVEVVSTYGVTRRMNAGHCEVRVIAKSVRKQGLLNVPGDIEFLFESLPLAFPFDQARVIENAGGFYGKGVENLSIQLGKSSRTAGIEIDDSEKMPTPRLNRGTCGVRPCYGIKGNSNNRAKRLRHDALRCL